MASSIFHDIRNPIQFVSLALDHLSDKKQRGKKKGFEIRDLFADAHSELIRVSGMIQGLLDYGRPQVSKLEVENASEILAESHKEVVRCHPEAKLRISLEGIDDVFPVLADRDHLFRALMNLLENALEAGGPEGLVRAGLGYQTENKSDILLWVEDSGPGITEENLGKIFTPYFTTKKGGIGLGLTLTKKWVNEMGGEIQVHNRLGGGVRFELSFPVADRAADGQRGKKNKTAIFELSQRVE
jgi:signal transduction histidine kinase